MSCFCTRAGGNAMLLKTSMTLIATVLAAGSAYADRDGRNAFPKVATLACDCGITPRAVQKALRRLENDRLVEVQREATQHQPRCYRIVVPQTSASSPTASGEPAFTSDRSVSEESAQAVDITSVSNEVRGILVPE
jgi:helix-turn-helix protein